MPGWAYAHSSRAPDGVLRCALAEFRAEALMHAGSCLGQRDRPLCDCLFQPQQPFGFEGCVATPSNALPAGPATANRVRRPLRAAPGSVGAGKKRDILHSCPRSHASFYLGTRITKTNPKTPALPALHRPTPCGATVHRKEAPPAGAMGRTDPASRKRPCHRRGGSAARKPGAADGA